VLLKRIPRACRLGASFAFGECLRQVISGGRVQDWKRLLQFPSCFQKPFTTGRRHRLTTQVSAQIDLFEQGSDSHSINPLRPHLGNRPIKWLNLDAEAARWASVKLSDGDVHGTIRMLASDDSYVVPNIQALDLLRSKHPAAPPDRRPVPLVTASTLQCCLEQALSALHSFRPGSSSGPDGLHPQHVQDMFQAAGLMLDPVLVDFANMVLFGGVPNDLRR